MLAHGIRLRAGNQNVLPRGTVGSVHIGPLSPSLIGVRQRHQIQGIPNEPVPQREVQEGLLEVRNARPVGTGALRGGCWRPHTSSGVRLLGRDIVLRAHVAAAPPKTIRSVIFSLSDFCSLSSYARVLATSVHASMSDGDQLTK